MASFRERVRGEHLVAAALRRAGDAAVEKLGEAMVDEAEEIIEESKPKVPVRFGDLRQSGHVLKPKTIRGLRSGRVEVKAGFGGKAGIGNQGETNDEVVGYGIIVHERTDVHHDNGQAKFLESTADERRQGIRRRVASKIEDAIEQAV